jgi:hypothetical protein
MTISKTFKSYFSHKHFKIMSILIQLLIVFASFSNDNSANQSNAVGPKVGQSATNAGAQL